MNHGVTEDMGGRSNQHAIRQRIERSHEEKRSGFPLLLRGLRGSIELDRTLERSKVSAFDQENREGAKTRRKGKHIRFCFLRVFATSRNPPRVAPTFKRASVANLFLLQRVSIPSVPRRAFGRG